MQQNSLTLAEFAPPQPPLYDPDELSSAWNVLFVDGDVVELRVFNASQLDSRGWACNYYGYFDNLETLYSALITFDNFDGAYVTINPVAPELLHRTGNNIERSGNRAPQTGDTEIPRRCWFFVDCDPRRATGISSTADQHAAAAQKAGEIRDFLLSIGFPPPVEADSGNGSHLLFRIDLPNTPEATATILKCLEALKERFGDPEGTPNGVSIDTTVHNASRICRMYGTRNSKGAHTAQRPHRLSKILVIPPELQTVAPDVLQDLAALAPQPTTARPSRTSPRANIAARSPNGTERNCDDFDLQAWIDRYELDVSDPTPYQGTGTRWLLTTSPMCEHHGDGPHVLRLPDGPIVAGCSHASCNWNWHDLREKFDPAAERRSKADQGTDPEDDATDTDTPKMSVSQCLVAIGSADELWFDEDDEAYASIAVSATETDEAHVAHFTVRSRDYKRLLVKRLHIEYGRVAGGQAISDALLHLEAIASGSGRRYKKHLRTATFKNGDEYRLYLDLCNDAWQVVEIRSEGWRVIESAECPVRFVRYKSMLPLPVPVPRGSRNGCGIDALREFANVTDRDWPLLLGWMVAALRPGYPYGVLSLIGEQGSAKTTTARAIRNLLDPNTSPERCEPKTVQDLMIAAHNSNMIVLDNLSYTPLWLSDALCRLSTGGGMSVRAHYENKEETIFYAKRPIILNGIEPVVGRADLTDRAVFLELPHITTRRTEAEFWGAFEAKRACMLGALLDAASVAIARLSAVCPVLSRMADLCTWATAAEPGLELPDGAFMAALTLNRASANETVLDGSLLAMEIRRMLRERGAWDGTATDLLHNLQLGAQRHAGSTGWPKNPRALSGQLRRLVTNFRDADILVEFQDTRPKTIRIRSASGSDATGNST